MSDASPMGTPEWASATNAMTKPFWKTTEFWMTVGAHLLSVLMLSGWIGPDSQYMPLAALLLSAFAQAGYNVGKPFEKGKAHEANGLFMAAREQRIAAEADKAAAAIVSEMSSSNAASEKPHGL
jgi:hypothetical protein